MYSREVLPPCYLLLPEEMDDRFFGEAIRKVPGHSVYPFVTSGLGQVFVRFWPEHPGEGFERIFFERKVVRFLEKLQTTRRYRRHMARRGVKRRQGCRRIPLLSHAVVHVLARPGTPEKILTDAVEALPAQTQNVWRR